MSHCSEELLDAQSDSFWEPGNYRRTTKRIDDGYRLCNDLQQLVQERASIEKTYAKHLSAWAKRWSDHVEKSTEYGTTAAAWKAVLTEAEQRSDLHLLIRQKLISHVNDPLRQWQKEQYHHSLMQIKERRDMEELFKKAQKPWAKLLVQVTKTQADYYAACKAENSAKAVVASEQTYDDAPEQPRKIEQRLRRAKELVFTSKERYKHALHDLTQYNAVYMENMGTVFQRCQNMESERIEFFKQIFMRLHESLDLRLQMSRISQIYEDFHNSIANVDVEKDLNWWANHFGVNMAMKWPKFEEYAEDTLRMRHKYKLPSAITEPPRIAIIKHAITTGNEASTLQLNKEEQQDNKTQAKPDALVVWQQPSRDRSASKKAEKKDNNQNSDSEPKASASSNPFGEESDEDEGDEQEIIAPGVPVKALYDYKSTESDELSFSRGDVFVKVKEVDSQGWCRGRKDGKVGFYPANYVEPTTIKTNVEEQENPE